jgi:hypothetical protein
MTATAAATTTTANESNPISGTIVEDIFLQELENLNIHPMVNMGF